MMIYKEEIRDLFEAPDDYVLVHCMVDATWHNSEYILEAEDFDGVEFTVQNEKDGVEIEEINVEDNSIDTSKPSVWRHLCSVSSSLMGISFTDIP